MYERSTSQKNPPKLEVFMDDMDLGLGEQSFVNKTYSRDLICSLVPRSLSFFYFDPPFFPPYTSICLAFFTSLTMPFHLFMYSKQIDLRYKMIHSIKFYLKGFVVDADFHVSICMFVHESSPCESCQSHAGLEKKKKARLSCIAISNKSTKPTA